MRIIWSLLCGVVSLVCPTKLWARPEIHVVVAVPGAWPEGVEAAVRAASNQLRQFDLVLVSVPEKKVDGDSVDSLLAKAEEAFAASELESAQLWYDKAFLALEQSAKMNRPMAELFLSRARFFYVQNDLAATKKELNTAARLDPTLAPDPIQYSPKMIKLHKEAILESKKKGSATLTIEAPEGANVWLDGSRYQPNSSLQVGSHYLRIEKAGFLPLVQVFSLTKEEILQITLETDQFAVDQQMREETAKNPNHAVEWAKKNRWNDLIVLGWSGSQWHITHWKEESLVSETNSPSDKLSGALVKLIEPAGPLTVAPPEIPSNELFWKKPVFWVPVGVGVLGGAVLLSLDLLNENNGARPSIDLRGRP